MKEALKIKVCGMRDPENIKGVVAAKPDYLGLIFYGRSKRYVGRNPDVEILNAIPKTIKKTGVFVNEHIEEVQQISIAWGLDAIQLHGQESSEYCTEIMKSGLIILKAFSIDNNFDFNGLEFYKEACDYFLFDTKGKLPGGTGQKFNWKLLAKYTMDIPFFLSGGILPEDYDYIREFNHSQFYGIDVNSGFEVSPALKDVEKIKKFIREIRKK